MPGEDAFKVEGLITDRRPNGTFAVRLANGHCLLGFLTGRARQKSGALNPGDRVRLRLSPFDLSQGRIILDEEKK